LTIVDAEVLERLERSRPSTKSLFAAARQKIPNWGPAANSKALHQLLPRLFVMWDVNIEPYADDYADFTAEMHRLALRLIEEGPYVNAEELELRLQEHLGYGIRKTLAKYLDETNWYVMVGADRLAQSHLRSPRLSAFAPFPGRWLTQITRAGQNVTYITRACASIRTEIESGSRTNAAVEMAATT
jgi:hypothetical protein